MEDYFILGTTLKEQVEITKEPHRYEGNVYHDGAEMYMFCQVDYNTFTFVNLTSGNRLCDPIKGYYDGNSTGMNQFRIMGKILENVDGSELKLIHNTYKDSM